VQNLGYHFDECRFKEAQNTRFLLKHLMRLWVAPGFKPLRIVSALSSHTWHLKPPISRICSTDRSRSI
jgi:hypothetical protein